SWAVRIYYKPFVRWIWAGSLIMSFGGLLAMSDRRYRFRKSNKAETKTKLNEQEA
ncbi:cytochrome c-type biogenesis CcmF C-terminal domain-containing protein, partial [Vibrio vulnificus]